MRDQRKPLPGLGDRSIQGEKNARRSLKNCVFVSHSSKDSAFISENVETILDQALSVATYTRKHGTWFYPYGIFCVDFVKLGNLYASTVNIALIECRAFVLVVSQNATMSDWVKRELTFADEHIARILSISIDGTSFQEFATAIGRPEIFSEEQRVSSVHLTSVVPAQTIKLLAVATEYLRCRYTTSTEMMRPLGNPISD